MEYINQELQDKLKAGVRFEDLIGDFTTYRIFEDGEVFSARTSKGLFRKMTPSVSSSQLPNQKGKGYKFFRCTLNGLRIPKKVHRLVAGFFISNPEQKCCVNHKDGNKLNNHVDNLEWVTLKENSQHAVQTLKANCGEDNYISKLDRHQVAWIRHAKHGHKQNILADLFKVNKTTIHNIIHRHSWAQFP